MELNALLEYAYTYESSNESISLEQAPSVLAPQNSYHFKTKLTEMTVCFGIASLVPLFIGGDAAALQHSDMGPSVTQLQKNLTNAGFYNGPITGFYGDLTKASVTRFQTSNALAADGVAGSSTLAVLKSVNSSVVASSSSSSSSNILQQGVSGPQVRQLQNQLKAVGLFQGNTTDYFGDKTKSAVIAFQTREGLNPDGVAGNQTLAALNRSTVTSQNSATVASSTSASQPVESVKVIQRQLKTAGYYSANIDGIHGRQTTQAIEAFQRDRNLIVDGVVGPATQAALDSNLQPQNASTSPSEDSASNSATGLLRVSKTPKAEVETLQKALSSQGHHPGPIDGIFGPLTEQALKSLQSAKGITVDGVFGPETFTAMNAAAPASAEATGDRTTTPVTAEPTIVTIDLAGGGSVVVDIPTQTQMVASGNSQPGISIDRENLDGGSTQFPPAQATPPNPSPPIQLDLNTVEPVPGSSLSGEKDYFLMTQANQEKLCQRQVLGPPKIGSDTICYQATETVKHLHEQLEEVKRRTNLDYDISADQGGDYDTDTEKAVIAFQQEYGIAMTGIVGEATNRTLEAVSDIRP